VHVCVCVCVCACVRVCVGTGGGEGWSNKTQAGIKEDTENEERVKGNIRKIVTLMGVLIPLFRDRMVPEHWIQAEIL
jgi:hypothetical protein